MLVRRYNGISLIQRDEPDTEGLPGIRANKAGLESARWVCWFVRVFK